MSRTCSASVLGIVTLAACAPTPPTNTVGGSKPLPVASQTPLAVAAPAGCGGPVGVFTPVEAVETTPASVVDPSDPKLVCEMADANLAAAEKAILADKTPRPKVDSKPWDKKQKPKYLDLVDARLHLSAADKALLAKNGFVVSEPSFESTFSWAYHEIYQSQLPVYVSADAILHAVYASNDKLIEAVERKRLAPLLGQALVAMHCALADAATKWPADVAKAADVYLTVARTLLADAEVPSVLGTDAEARALVAAIKKADGIKEVSLFGRPRLVDFGAYTPRGHYADKPKTDADPEPPPSLAPYFRAAMWLSRLELNLVSRSCRSSQPGAALDPSETPFEAALALGLVELADHGKADVAIDQLDRAWALLAGKREDVSFADLRALRKKAGITTVGVEAAPALRAAIGSGFSRTARLHPMPEGVKDLPVIFTLLGPRVVPDTAALHLLLNDEVPKRPLPHAGDVAYVLGHDRGKAYIEKDLKEFAPILDKNLEKARAMLAGPLPEGDLYSAWLGAIRGVAHKPAGLVPSFMGTEAFADLRINTTVAAYGQLRHNFVLMAGEEVGAAGCEIPDGFVDPVPAVYQSLLGYAKRGEAVFAELDPKDELHARAYFARLSRTVSVLAAIADDELAGRALTVGQRRFLSMIAEYRPPSTGGPATYTGWYFDLFRERTEDGLTPSAFLASYATSAMDQTVVYAGATAPRLGVFVVDVGGPPRVVVGPVARAFETVGPTSKRFTDADVWTVTKSEPWAASYVAPAVAEPPLLLDGSTNVFTLRSNKALGPVTLTVLDHHRRPKGSLTKTVGTKEVTFTFPGTGEGLEGVAVKVGTFQRVLTATMGAMGPGSISAAFGGMTPPKTE